MTCPCTFNFVLIQQQRRSLSAKDNTACLTSKVILQLEDYISMGAHSLEAFTCWME